MTLQIHFQEKGILPKLGHQIVAIYDWLSGPPMTEHERVTRAVEAAGMGLLKRVGGPGI